MRHCTTCGEGLPGGRFCSHCGSPVGNPPAAPAGADVTQVRSASGTAERPAVGQRSVVPPPPPLPPAPPTARYPLYADEVVPPVEQTDERVLFGLGSSPAQPAGPGHGGGPGRRTPWLPWLAAAAVLVLVAALGAGLLLGDDDPQPAATGSTAEDGSPGPRAGRGRSPEASTPAAATPPPAPPTAPPTRSAKEPRRTPRDVGGDAVAAAPATAPPSTDLAGGTTRYDADRMLDGVPTTCWRMPGDGTGSTLTFTLARPTRVTRVGLVNGYAKTGVGAQGSELDWYAGNRRVLAVEWVFDDGTTVRQDLQETRELQEVRVPRVTTSSVALRLLEVTEPGAGPARRDNTAVSEVLLVGAPA